MRDDSTDTKIPTEFMPSTYYVEALEKAQRELKRLQTISSETALVFAKKEFAEVIKNQQERISENNNLRKKYKDMLLQVKEWQPPSPEHLGLKDFMVQQITDSIKWDCNNSYLLDNPPKLLGGNEWLSQKTAKVLKDIEYHTKENQEEIERAKTRTMWIKQLRNSLGIEDASSTKAKNT